MTGKNWNDFYLKGKEFFAKNLEITFTTKAGDGTSLARECLEKGFKNIVAIGGDGTINEVSIKQDDKGIGIGNGIDRWRTNRYIACNVSSL